ncbi:MAG TPA: hypothetical protein ACFYD7_11470 [Candidatus Wujingus californicus]|uniref:hypothetical protein n=2 Tax=Candidatus Wujingus californicus TaxID=3367618 RepID=UPI001DA4269F|nr:hypothetical protein [Planctomycetota bacterium]MDO8130517.1 hypothetical protein [Candidatus Brocadiales bacterium]
MSVVFIACVESGNLENQALLLFRSIRKYAGRYKNAPIYSFQPRNGKTLKEDTLKAFEDLGVMHSTEKLNTEFHYYPRANKIFACARAEEVSRQDIFVFLDSDTVVMNEPDSFELPNDMVAAVRPVDNKNEGSAGIDDPNDEYWKKMYLICGVPETPFVESVVDRKKIRSYWNSGLVVMRRSEGLFQQWRDNFIKLMQAKHAPGGRLAFVEQLSLSPTLAKVADKIKILDYRYNYPLPKRSLLVEPYRSAQLEDLIHIHYHRWFNKPGFLEMLMPPLNRHSEIYKWISSFLPFQPTINDPLRF